jgi:EF-P beta-lysylation protein EpmB
MIPPSPTRLETAQWQRDLAEAFSDPVALLAFLDIAPAALEGLDLGSQPFPLRVTRHFASLMGQGDPHDPLLLQVLPTLAEREKPPGYRRDPVGDLDAVLETGLLQKYSGRALAVVTGACAVHCRYCFRRHYPYPEQGSLRHWGDTLATLQHHPDIDELILSGGDPLSLSDQRLSRLIADVEKVPHISRLRIHTRQPVVLPNRVTDALCDRLRTSRLNPVVVLHVNHPNEICDALVNAVSRLRDAGCTLLNQAVLLKNINDKADTLINLSRELFAAGVLPYYLHLLDAVQGAAHFEVTTAEAVELERAMRSRLPGYLVPKLVREIAGETAKTPLSSMTE